MKRFVAVLLTGCLTFQNFMGAVEPVEASEFSSGISDTEIFTTEPDNEENSYTQAETPDGTADRTAEEISSDESVSETEEEPVFGAGEEEPVLETEEEALFQDGSQESYQSNSDSGSMEVRLISVNSTVQNATVSIKEKNSQEIISQGVPDSGGVAQFANLTPGDYVVTIKADQYAAYTQMVTVNARSVSKIQVYSEETEDLETTPGWMIRGDANGDGVIDEADTREILNIIRNDSYSSLADLVGQEKKVDIADLQQVVQVMDETAQVSSVETEMLPQAIEIDEETTKVVSGTLESLSQDEGSVTLAAASEESISEQNPVVMNFTLSDASTKDAIAEVDKIMIKEPVADLTAGTDDTNITSGTIEYTYLDENNEERTASAEFTAPVAAKAARVARASGEAEEEVLFSASAVTAERDENGSLIINLGTQVAIKRVTIKITGTKKTEPLVEIASVKFVNEMEGRIPAPQLDTPAIQSVETGDKELTVTWDAKNNVTGYELYVEGIVDGGSNASQTIPVDGTQQNIVSINGKDLKNFAVYTIKVRAVNEDWTSPWSDVVTASPKPDKIPDGPDNVKAEGGYRSIKVSWKDMDDSNGYMVYYKEKDGETFIPVVDGFTEVQDGTGKISGTSYTITGLKDDTSYVIYVKGWNELGWGSASLEALTTTDGATPQLPNYEVINTPNERGVLTNHIVSAVLGGSGKATMVESALDPAGSGTANGVVDNDYGSYWTKSDWDDGVSYPGLDKGVTITLDADYKMSYLTFAAAGTDINVHQAKIRYWSTADNSKTGTMLGASLIGKKDENNNTYYVVKFDTAITANKIQLCIGRSWGDTSAMRIGEIRFHNYDSLEDDIRNLYEDEMHTTLVEGTDEAVIAALEERLEAGDANGEKHPLYDSLKLELKNARDILASNLDETYVVDNRITAKKDTNLGFGGLNAWQPLGRVADEGETLIVYVGHNTKQTGQNADLQLVFTQYHAESDSLVKTVNLKVGKNEITVPSITNNNFERGGQIYIAYTGNSTSDQYGVCINGGTKIPVLNLYKKTGEERTAAIQKYIEDLEEYNSTSIETKHEAHTKGNAEYSYDEKNCIYNATDIMLDQMMYSVPATKVWNNLSGSSDKVTQLENALDAMDQMMTLFYQHKGLSDSAGTSKGNNALPSEHLNIRYMRMFSGAFMYAAGNHIGIEWDSTNFVSSASSLDSFGWGIAHEIGHDINQSSYAVAEITNNYFAQLLTKAVKGTRFTYENVYDKVTSGATGRDSNLATQLAMYWQLHLAFDNNKDDRYIYDNYQDQFNNLFFARVDTYARNPGKAPQSGMTLGSDVDQNLMRLSCAAANKNILSFFRRWGMTPDADTIAYAAKYGEEDEKALYYVNDDARDYRADHADEAGTIKGQDVATATVSADGNQVKVTINTSADTNLILGYEIIRSITSNGETKSQVVGFQTIEGATTTFVDTIATMNNRVMSYEVKAVDKYLNYSNSTKAGSVKVETGGVLNKSAWTVETNLNSEDDTEIIPDAEDPDSGYSSIPSLLETKTVHSIDRVIDNSQDTVYHGTISGEAEITIDMHKVEEVTSLKYKGSSLAGVTVAVSENGSDWTTVKENYEGCTAGSSTYSTIWFDSVEEESRSNWIGTYNAQYVKLIIPQAGSVDINEIEICGPTGDNLEFQMSEDSLAVGILADDYQYGADLEDMIPQGSLVFTGTYKGNPAYNVVVLYDTDGNVIGSDGENVNAQQVIFADAPENGDLGETSDGTWVYYVTPENWDEDTISQIKGVRGELYRVDNALTLAGERIVSDTLIMDIPEILPDITLTGQKTTSEQ